MRIIARLLVIMSIPVLLLSCTSPSEPEAQKEMISWEEEQIRSIESILGTTSNFVPQSMMEKLSNQKACEDYAQDKYPNESLEGWVSDNDYKYSPRLDRCLVLREVTSNLTGQARKGTGIIDALNENLLFDSAKSECGTLTRETHTP